MKAGGEALASSPGEIAGGAGATELLATSRTHTTAHPPPASHPSPRGKEPSAPGSRQSRACRAGLTLATGLPGAEPVLVATSPPGSPLLSSPGTRAPHASVMHWLTVLLPVGSPRAKGLLAFGASPPAGRRDLLEEMSLRPGTASPQWAMRPHGLPELRASLLTAPGQEAAFLGAAVPPGIS